MWHGLANWKSWKDVPPDVKALLAIAIVVLVFVIIVNAQF